MMAWQKGPLPADTYNWGGVVTTAMKGQSGFLFADFRGDHAILCPGDGLQPQRIEAADVLWYDNSLILPPVEG